MDLGGCGKAGKKLILLTGKGAIGAVKGDVKK